MTDERGIPTACARCASLLTQGTTTCRVCGWDMTGQAGSLPPSAPPTPAAPPTVPPAGGRFGGDQFGAYGQPAVQPGYHQPAAPGGFGQVPPAPGYPMPGRSRAPLGVGTAAAVLVGLAAGATVLTLLVQGAYAGRMRALRDASIRGEEIDEKLSAALAIEGLFGLASILEAVVLVAAAVTTIVWTFKARNHAASLGTHPQRYTGGWVVAGWLVPIISLFYPFRVVTDIWTANDPQHGRSPRGVIALWWATFLVGGFFSYASLRASTTANGKTSTTTIGQNTGFEVTLLDWVGAGLGIVAAIAFIHMVRTIRGWQQQPAVPRAPLPTPV